jgi:protein-S-isoprenylcysteine O-methyltransferase Ste14
MQPAFLSSVVPLGLHVFSGYDTISLNNSKEWEGARMNVKLFFQAIAKFSLGVVLVGALIFLPAGTFAFPSGWLLMGILFVPMFLAGLVMMAKNPDLLKSRLVAKEKQKDQDLVVKLSGLMFIAGFIVAGLDFRFHWCSLPNGVIIGAAAAFLLAYVLYAEVLRENTYLSRTIEVQENQKVIDTGLYGIVRHPMYSATVLLFLSMPLVLGSLYAFLIFLTYPLIIAKRIKGEESFLAQELEGYRAYKEKVKYRLIPFIW